MTEDEHPNRITIRSILPAIKRARIPLVIAAATYIVSILVGIVMVDLGVHFAVDARDNIVGQAYSGSDATINALTSGRPLQAAFSDFAGNLIIGAVPSTVAGLGVITSLPLLAYRGWIGGIVSIDSNHASRLAQPSEAAYYLLTLFLQLIPYSLAGGAGIHLGLSFYRNYSNKQVPKWLFIPKAALIDVARIYILIVPLFLVASMWEFLAR